MSGIGGAMAPLAPPVPTPLPIALLVSEYTEKKSPPSFSSSILPYFYNLGLLVDSYVLIYQKGTQFNHNPLKITEIELNFHLCAVS